MSNIDWDKPLEILLQDGRREDFNVTNYARGADGLPMKDRDGDYILMNKDGELRFREEGRIRNVPDTASAFDHWLIVYEDGSTEDLTFDTFMEVQREVEKEPEFHKNAVAVRLRRRREDAPATVEIVEQAAL